MRAWGYARIKEIVKIFWAWRRQIPPKKQVRTHDSLRQISANSRSRDSILFSPFFFQRSLQSFIQPEQSEISRPVEPPYNRLKTGGFKYDG